MPRRNFLYPFCVSLVLAGSAACGGKAVSGENDVLSVDEPGGDAPVTDAPSTEPALAAEPGQLHTLELRRVEAGDETTVPSASCEYSERLKVYFRSRTLITRTCFQLEGGYTGDREEQALLDTDLQRIQAAYDQLRPAGGAQCEISEGWLSLVVESEQPDATRQVLDVEHSACPLDQPEGKTFVAGLEQLYRVLADVRAQEPELAPDPPRP